MEADSVSGFSDKVISKAQELIAAHGDNVENATTELMIGVLDSGDIDQIVYWLRVRQCIRLQSSRERYTRRLPDKIVWAVEQAVEQGRVGLAKLLGRAYRSAKEEEKAVAEDRRESGSSTGNQVGPR